MRVSRIVSKVDVVGTLWMPAVNGAYTYDLTSYDVENLRGDDGTITREDIESWLATHAGDFQHIIDFRATVGDGEFDCDFATEDGEIAYIDCFPEED